MVNLPSGYRFKPTHCAMIRYLQCKAKEEPLPREAAGCISEADLYGQKEPWEIFQDFGVKKSRYFFTRLKKKGEKNGRRIARKLGLSGGKWNGETKGITIYDDGVKYPKKEIGVRKSFSYSNDKLQQYGGGDFRWLMTEYTLSGDSLKDPKLKHLNYAVCLIKKIKPNRQRARDDDSADDDLMIGARFNDPSEHQDFVDQPDHQTIVKKIKDGGVVIGKKRKVTTSDMNIREECTSVLPGLAVDDHQQQQAEDRNRLWDYSIDRWDDVMMINNTELPATHELSNVQQLESWQPFMNIPEIDRERAFEQLGGGEDSNMDYAKVSEFGQEFAKELLGGESATKIIEQVQSHEELMVPNPFWINWAFHYCGNYPLWKT